MNPHLTQAVAEQRIRDLHAESAARRLAAGPGAKARGTWVRGAGRLIRSLGRRRYRQVELIWPDGVCSVVPVQSDDRPRPLANTRH